MERQKPLPNPREFWLPSLTRAKLLSLPEILAACRTRLYRPRLVPARKGRNHIAGRLLFGIAAIHAVGATLVLWASARKERIRAELVFFEGDMHGPDVMP
ncbi:MAG TPA: hypothetical protein DD465_18585 [Thalassospira sp.]|nr:hypothetical protein [Thalassospira sp.]